MVPRTSIAVLCLWLVAGCGHGPVEPAKRTLTGVTRQQALIAAQHTVANQGLDTEELDYEKGVLKTNWSHKQRQQVQYEVAVTPANEDMEVETVVVAVSSKTRHKTIGGWSEPAVSNRMATEKLLDEIVEKTTDRFRIQNVPQKEKEPECARSEDCAMGSHCGSGQCVTECSSDTACDAEKECDERGRCIPTPPEIVEPVEPEIPEKPSRRSGNK